MSDPGNTTVTPTNGPAVATAHALQTLIKEISGITQPEEQEQLMASGNFDADIVVIGAGPDHNDICVEVSTQIGRAHV